MAFPYVLFIALIADHSVRSRVGLFLHMLGFLLLDNVSFCCLVWYSCSNLQFFLVCLCVIRSLHLLSPRCSSCTDCLISAPLLVVASRGDKYQLKLVSPQLFDDAYCALTSVLHLR